MSEKIENKIENKVEKNKISKAKEKEKLKKENWDKIKKIISEHPRHSLDGMCEQYKELDKLRSIYRRNT